MTLNKRRFGNPKSEFNTMDRKMDDKSYESYELINLIFKDGSKVSAWWNGFSWDSYREINEAPIFWRKKYDR